MWVPTTSCPTSQCTKSRMTTGSSTTYKSTSQSTTVTYGQGSVSGAKSTDQICLEASISSCTETDYSFIAASSASSLTNLYADGVVGMTALPIDSASLLLPSLEASGAVDDAIFILDLQYNETQSYLYIGGYPSSHP
mmetsp:Transcript_1883/g.1331  ORF Transcript_1883/g.1331 Transcript_1883/m.1331 type:complete len:137 (-) Transcript_1883:450-860(-)